LIIIYKNNKDYSEIELSRKNGYYSFYCTDMKNYNKILLEYKKKELLPIMHPITIYNNNKFTSIYLENKYKNIIQDKIINDKQVIDNVDIIQKIEHRKEIIKNKMNLSKYNEDK
jgi:hypothetical protein